MAEVDLRQLAVELREDGLGGREERLGLERVVRQDGGIGQLDVAVEPKGRVPQGGHGAQRQLLGQRRHVLPNPVGLETQAPRILGSADEPGEDRRRMIHPVVACAVGEEARRVMKKRLKAQLARRRDGLPRGAPRKQELVGQKDDVPGALDPQSELQEVPSGVVGQGLASQRLERGQQLPEIGRSQRAFGGGDGAQATDDSPILRGRLAFT